MELKYVHRNLLKTIKHLRVVTETDAKKWLSLKIGSPVSLFTLLDEINNVICTQRQLIKCVVNEFNGERELVFVTYGNEDSFNCYYPELDLQYFQCILDCIILSQTKSITKSYALKIGSNVNKVIFYEKWALGLLERWVFERYLRISPNGEYTLDTLGIYQFERYFIYNFDHAIFECNFCTSRIFQKADECPYCQKIFHAYCFEWYAKNIRKWPCCRKEIIL